jgi:hypothetical protein
MVRDLSSRFDEEARDRPDQRSPAMTTTTIATHPLTRQRCHGTTAARRANTHATAKTQWIDVASGERLSRTALDELRRRAHFLYEANTHIFEDERDALGALGVVPMWSERCETS